MNFNSRPHLDDVINGVFVCAVLTAALSLSFNVIGGDVAATAGRSVPVLASAHHPSVAVVALR